MSGAPFDPKSPSMDLWRALITRGVDADEATELMNGYAHELAERQRNYCYDVGIEVGPLPDLIDPERDSR